MKIVINKANVKEILNNQISDIKVKKIKYITTGSNCNIYLVNNEYIFKFPRHDKGNNDLIREKMILNLIGNKVPITIPSVRYFEKIKGTDFYFMGYKKLNGTFLSRKVYKRLSPEKKESIAKEIANFLKILHNIKYKNVDYLTIKTIDKYKKDLEYLKTNCFDNFSSDIVSNINSFFYDLFNTSNFFNYNQCIIHNDFSSSNILINKKTGVVTGIIDFSDTAISDPDNDFHMLLVDDKNEAGKDFGFKVLEYYNHEDVELVMKKADFYQLYWMFDGLILGYQCNIQKWIDEATKTIIEYFTYE